MLNKSEKAEMETLRREVTFLRQKNERLEAQLGRSQDTISDLEILIENLERSISKNLLNFKQAVVERLTGTPPNEQS